VADMVDPNKARYAFYMKANMSDELKLMASGVRQFVFLAYDEKAKVFRLASNVAEKDLEPFIKALRDSKGEKRGERAEEIEFDSPEEAAKMIAALERSGIKVTREEEVETDERGSTKRADKSEVSSEVSSLGE